MGSSFAQFEGHKYLSIETYRKTGVPVRTPVWFVENNGALYVRTAQSTGKYRRIRNNPDVKVAPCSSTGKVKGEWVRAEASVAPAAETEEAYRLLEAKYGLIYTLTKIFMRKKYAVLKIRGKDG